MCAHPCRLITAPRRARQKHNRWALSSSARRLIRDMTIAERVIMQWRSMQQQLLHGLAAPSCLLSAGCEVLGSTDLPFILNAPGLGNAWLWPGFFSSTGARQTLQLRQRLQPESRRTPSRCILVRHVSNCYAVDSRNLLSSDEGTGHSLSHLVVANSSRPTPPPPTRHGLSCDDGLETRNAVNNINPMNPPQLSRAKP